MDKARPKIPSELRELMAEIGPQWSPAKHVRLMLDKFSELHRTAPTEGVETKAGIPYGPHPRHQLDLYRPTAAASGRPAVVFVHGGAFLDGDRNRTDEIYANVLRYFARNDVVGVNIGYRLAGDARYPGATDDVAAAVAWTNEHASEIGIDHSRIFLMGHSAGAAHTGSYVYDKSRRKTNEPELAGHLVVSGRVRAETRPQNPNAHKVAAYYGTDNAEALADVSPVTHVNANSIPTFIAWAEFENPLIDVHCSELAFQLGEAKHRCPPLAWLRGHNHTSSIAHINTAEDELGQAMLDFIANPR